MALRLSYDITGSYITDPQQSILDGLARGRDAAKLKLTRAWIAPGDTGLTLQPVNVTPAWTTAAGKLTAADYLQTAANWESVEHRGTGDWFQHSKGAAREALKTRKAYPENCGWFAEFWAYGIPGTDIRDLAIITFGDRYRLHVHSWGVADFEDLHPAGGGPTQYLTAGRDLSAGGGKILGQLVQIGILPWRRGRVLVWTNLGAHFEVAVGERLDSSDPFKPRMTLGQPGYHVITERAQASLDFAQATQITNAGAVAVKAFGTINPLFYPTTGTVLSPVLSIPYGTTHMPDTSQIRAETQDGTAATLTLLDDKGAPFFADADHRKTSIQYSIALAAPDPVSGPWSLVAPVVFDADISFDRQLGVRTYTTNVINQVQDASLTLSRNRADKSFSFTLDNPGEAWTSLKDLWCRKMIAEIIADGNGQDPDSTTVFVGLSDPAYFQDGSASRIVVPSSGMRKQLRAHLLSDGRKYDGTPHAQAVRKILLDAGVPANKIVIEDDGVLLDSADPGEDPLWKPSNGTSADEFIEHIAQVFSGYIFDDIADTFYYVSRDYFTAAALADELTLPQVLMVTPKDGVTGWPDPDALGVNPNTMIALADSVSQTAEEPRANDIWVLGLDAKTGEICGAHYEDTDSIKTRTAFNYVGIRKILIYASASLTSKGACEYVCGILSRTLTQPVRMVAFRLPDYQWQRLPLDGPLHLHGYGNALVAGVSASFANDRLRLTDYTVELL